MDTIGSGIKELANVIIEYERIVKFYSTMNKICIITTILIILALAIIAIKSNKIVKRILSLIIILQIAITIYNYNMLYRDTERINNTVTKYLNIVDNQVRIIKDQNNTLYNKLLNMAETIIPRGKE